MYACMYVCNRFVLKVKLFNTKYLSLPRCYRCEVADRFIVVAMFKDFQRVTVVINFRPVPEEEMKIKLHPIDFLKLLLCTCCLDLTNQSVY